MKKSVLIAIQPYWVFLIIAKTMGWNIEKEKTIEVRKNFPKDENWDKTAVIYCSKDKKSFNRIPKEYQPAMKQFLGKVIGEFVCKKITEIKSDAVYSKAFGGFDVRFNFNIYAACLTEEQIFDYLGEGKGYGWHISDLVIYDNPKELSEFYHECNGVCVDTKKKVKCEKITVNGFSCNRCKQITRPPQSWCYVKDWFYTEEGGV